MHHAEPLLLFLIVPATMFVLANSLDSIYARVLILCAFPGVVAFVASCVFPLADGSFASVASLAAFVAAACLTLLGTLNPVKFFWAVRLLSASIALATVIYAAILSAIGSGSGIWPFVIIICLACSWFACKGRAWPSKRRFHVVMKDQNVPEIEDWNSALRREGFDLKLKTLDRADGNARRLAVIFQGTPTEFQFDVTPLSALVSSAEMDAFTANRLGEECVSANFRYSKKTERHAALVAAAALTRLNSGQLYDPVDDDWSDVDYVIETLQDIVHPLELCVLIDKNRLPTFEEWKQGLEKSGFDIVLQDPVDVDTFEGFHSIAFRGVLTGCALTLSPAPYIVKGDHTTINADSVETDGPSLSVTFRFADNSHAAVTHAAAAIFAQLAGGIVYDPRHEEYSTVEQLLDKVAVRLREQDEA